jgi:hypothetical protein
MRIPLIVRLLVVAAIEVIWNVFPSIPVTSASLMVIHGLLLLGVMFGTRAQSAYRDQSQHAKRD